MKMKLLYSALLALFLISPQAQAKLNIFACEPEWQALAQAIGGDKVKVTSATAAFQDPHHIEARPSLIAQTRRADLIICTGSDLEIGWLPLLLRQSGNKRVQVGQPGYFMASEQVERIEVPKNMDRSMGDIHAGGNPHVHLDPNRLLIIAKMFTQRLQVIDANNADFYEARFQHFRTKWLQAIQAWESQSAELKGKKVVVYHKNWSYLLAWLGIEVVADLEPKPGIPPTSAHLVSLLQVVKTEQPGAILIAAYQNDKSARWLAEKSGIPVLSLPFTVGGNEAATSLHALYSHTLTELLDTLVSP